MGDARKRIISSYFSSPAKERPRDRLSFDEPFRASYPITRDREATVVPHLFQGLWTSPSGYRLARTAVAARFQKGRTAKGRPPHAPKPVALVDSPSLVLFLKVHMKICPGVEDASIHALLRIWRHAHLSWGCLNPVSCALLTTLYLGEAPCPIPSDVAHPLLVVGVSHWHGQ